MIVWIYNAGLHRLFLSFLYRKPIPHETHDSVSNLGEVHKLAESPTCPHLVATGNVRLGSGQTFRQAPQQGISLRNQETYIEQFEVAHTLAICEFCVSENM